MENFNTTVAIAIVIVDFIVAFFLGYVLGLITKNDKKRQSNKCDCNDVNQCTKWCNAKKMFAKDFNNGMI